MKITALDEDLSEYDIDFLEKSLPEEADQKYFNKLMDNLGKKQGVLNAVKRIDKGYEIFYTPYNSITVSSNDIVIEIINNEKLKNYALIGYLKTMYGLIINKIQAVTLSEDEYQVIYI